MTFGERIVFYRKKAGLSQKGLAEALGISPTRLNYWEKDKREPDVAMINAICRQLGITGDLLLGREPTTQKSTPPLSDEVLKVAQDYEALDKYGKSVVLAVIAEEQTRIAEERASEESIFYIDEFLQPASAGTGDYVDDGSFRQRALRKKPPRGADFLVRVDGNSMEPTYYDGDLLFVREVETVNTGDIGIFSRGGDIYVKECGQDGLISHNPEFDDVLPFDDTDIRTIGKVLGICSADYL